MVLSGRKRTTVCKVLIERNDEGVVLDRPQENGFVALTGELHITRVVHDPGRSDASKPGNNGAGECFGRAGQSDVSGTRDDFLFIHYVTRILECRCYVLDGDFRIGVENLLTCISTCNHAEDVRHHNASAANDWFSAADVAGRQRYGLPLFRPGQSMVNHLVPKCRTSRRGVSSQRSQSLAERNQGQQSTDAPAGESHRRTAAGPTGSP